MLHPPCPVGQPDTYPGMAVPVFPSAKERVRVFARLGIEAIGERIALAWNRFPGLAKVFQQVARPQSFGEVFDAQLTDAVDAGAVASRAVGLRRSVVTTLEARMGTPREGDRGESVSRDWQRDGNIGAAENDAKWAKEG